MTRAARFVLWSLLFGLAYSQAPLYYSNQNQYFLHGLARAGWGHLDQDWLANTADPTPVFSSLVEVSYRFLPEVAFHAYYLLILGVYLVSLVALFDTLTGGGAGTTPRLLFITLVTLVHSAILRLASVCLTSVDYPWYFQAGVAGQYVLGAMFQPSVFGVLLIASIAAFVRGLPFLAVTLSALACIVHATYLLPAAFLTLAYLVQLGREHAFRQAAIAGVWSLLLVAPVVLYNWMLFAPADETSGETFAIAQAILAHFRIPHHAEPARWFDVIAGLQVLWIAASIWLVRRSRLLLVLLVPFVLGLAFTGIQLVTRNDTLALLFPWRISAVLLPVATAIFLTKLVQRLGPTLVNHEHLLNPACVLALGCFALGGIAVVANGLGFHINRDELPMMNWVKANKRPGDVFLLPVELPKTGAGSRGAASTNFTPAPRAGKAGNLIAIDLQRFRLYTGAPIFVDFKAIPYKDVEVLEWSNRLKLAQDRYQQGDWIRGRDALRRLGMGEVSHIVLPTPAMPRQIDWAPVYADEHYHVYALQ